jgi:thymidylate kinase
MHTSVPEHSNNALDDSKIRLVSNVLMLFGLDGSGKTTLATTMISHLNSSRQVAVYARPKFGERPRKATAREVPHSHSGGKSKLGSLTRALEASLLPYLLLEHFVASYIEIGKPLREGKCVIAERSWPDTIVDLVVDFGIPYNLAKRLVRPAMFGRNECLIFLDVPCEVALARKPGPYDIQYLSRRESAYRTVARDFRARSISTNQGIWMTSNELLNLVQTE